MSLVPSPEGRGDGRGRCAPTQGSGGPLRRWSAASPHCVGGRREPCPRVCFVLTTRLACPGRCGGSLPGAFADRGSATGLDAGAPDDEVEADDHGCDEQPHHGLSSALRERRSCLSEHEGHPLNLPDPHRSWVDSGAGFPAVRENESAAGRPYPTDDPHRGHPGSHYHARSPR